MTYNFGKNTINTESKLNRLVFKMEGKPMKTILATVASAAAITVAGVASAQDLGGAGGVSPYVSFEYTTTPTADDPATTTANEATWFGGDSSIDATLGATASLPWDLSMDASVAFTNDEWDFDYEMDGVSIGVSYEMASGLVIFSNTAFDANLDRTSTSIGASWSF